jgi:hypothetical protein
LAALAILLLTLGGAGGTLAYRQQTAEKLLKTGAEQLKRADYDAAVKTLQSVQTAWTLPGTADRTNSSLAQARRWQTDRGREVKAATLISEGKPEEALAELSAISADYPGRGAVTALIAQGQAAIDAAKQKAAEDAKKSAGPKRVGARVSNPSQTSLPSTSRSGTDRPDDYGGSQIHVMYIVPSDGTDRSLDTNGAIATSVLAANNWFASQAGKSFRLDKTGGALDVTFIRLGRTDADIASHGAYVRDELEDEIKARGFNQSNKLYAIYYDGTSSYACGGGAWPPALPGNTAALYLKGLPGGPVPCASNALAPNASAPGYFEFSFLHEIVHTLGFVATCAPNHTLSGHVGDDSTDLMYAGNQPWYPSKLDSGRNDYFAHSNGGCPDLADSPYLQ